MTKDDGEQRYVTLDLIRKRSEHNEGLVSTLEEIALHQEELEAIGPVLARTCGRTLRILLLQNNVISRMNPADLRPMKSLEYLNLALNNIGTIEGVGHCEFLNKLDLTLNFIDVDALEESIDNLIGCRNLRELYLMGNPCSYNEVDGDDETKAEKVATKPKQGWDGCRMYVIARLPQLSILDGKEVLRSERIKALQRLPQLTLELRDLSEKCRAVKASKRAGKVKSPPKDGVDDEELTEHSPEVRAEISREMAQQKADKEDKERANQPKRRGEKEFEEEQKAAIEKAREREERGDIRQCNEGKWHFSFDEEKRPGYVLLDISLQRHLSSSLVDVDVHPTYISIIIKSKVLRLVLPAEVKADESIAQRSTTTGHLLVSMPKVNPEENMLYIRAGRKAKEREFEEAAQAKDGEKNKANGKTGLASDMLEDATKMLKGSVCIDGLVEKRHGGVGPQPRRKDLDMKALSTQRKVKSPCDSKILNLGGTQDGGSSDEEDSPPPLF